MIKLNAKALRTNSGDFNEARKIKKNPIYIILDNVLDTYNIGSIFRLADAVAAEKVYLCGETLTPPNHRIKKASINTWQWVEWEYCETAVEAIKKLQSCHSERSEESPTNVGLHAQEILRSTQDDKLQIIVVEQDKRSIPYTKMQVDFPVAIVVGNETYGVFK